MEIPIARFRALVPELSEVTYPDPKVEVALEVAGFYIDPVDCWYRMLHGKSLEYALCLMAAHLLALQKQREDETNPGDAQGGFVQSASIGDVSVTKATIPAKDTWDWWLLQTPFGTALQALLQVVSVGGTFIGGLPETAAFRKVGGVF